MGVRWMWNVCPREGDLREMEGGGMTESAPFLQSKTEGERRRKTGGKDTNGSERCTGGQMMK